MNDDRGSLYLLTGLVFGVALGLLYAWVISPLNYIDTSPDILRNDYKDHYRVMVSKSYGATGDLERARARLALLNDQDTPSELAAQAQRYLANQFPDEDIASLANLASILSASLSESTQQLPQTQSMMDTPIILGETVETPIVIQTETRIPSSTKTAQPISSTPEIQQTSIISLTNTVTSESTRTPTSTPTQLPTRTLTPTPSPPFVLKNRQLVCSQLLNETQIQIRVEDGKGVGLPGIEIIITSDGYEESFFTGLKPEMGMGYADYTIVPDRVYSVHTAGGGQLVSGIVTPECSTAGGQRYWGSWLLVYTFPN